MISVAARPRFALIFRPNWGPKGRKKFFWRPQPPSPTPHLRVWMNAPPPPPLLSRGLDPALDFATQSCKTFVWWGRESLQSYIFVSFQQLTYKLNLETLLTSTRFVQIFESTIQHFFQTFSKTILYFSRLKVSKKAINRHIENRRNRAFFMMHCKRTINTV